MDNYLAVSTLSLRLNVLRMLNHYLATSEGEGQGRGREADLALIEREILDFNRQFQESWPGQLRAFRGSFGDLESRLARHMEKSEALRQAMEEEIHGLNETIKRLQNSNTQYLSQLVKGAE